MLLKTLASLFLTGLLALSLPAAAATGKRPLLPAPSLDSHGLYVEPWFEHGPLDLRTAARRAADDGKVLALLWEQRGCGYCRELHTVNLRMPRIAEYLARHFAVYQLDTHADDPVRDRSGAAVSQRRLAGRNRIPGTPTIQFFDADGQEVYRLPGYANPVVFAAAFEYVAEKGYESGSFRDWVRERLARLQSESQFQ